MILQHFWAKTGLRGQFVFLFLLISLVPLIIVSLLAYYYGVSALENTIGENLGQIAKEKLVRADRSILDRLSKIVPYIESLAPAVSQANGKNSSELPLTVVLLQINNELKDDIRQLEGYAGSYSKVIITNLHRQVIQASNSSLYLQEIHSDWWAMAYNNGYGYDQVGDVQYNQETQHHFLPATLPIRDSKNQVVGILHVEITLPELSDLVEKTGPEDGVESDIQVAIIDKTGKVISASPENNYSFGDDIEMSHAAMKAINAAKGSDEYYGYEMEEEAEQISDLETHETMKGEKKVYGWARTRMWESNHLLRDAQGNQNFEKWTVLVSLPASIAFSGITILTRQILIFTMVICILIIPIALIFSQRIVTPIMRVAIAARAIGHGEFDQEIPITTNDEVGILAAEFNAMRQNLKSAVEKLMAEEKKMTAVVDGLAEGLILVDSKDHILHINPAAEYILEIEVPNSGEVLTKVVEDDQLTKIFKENKDLIAENQVATSEVTLNHKKDGQTILRVIATAFLDEVGDVLGTVYLFQDITRDKEIDQMKSDFISLVSHELRTPLTSIIGFVSFILDGKTGTINEKQRDSLMRVHRQSKRLAALINDLLDISRIEAGRIEMKREPTSILEIAKQRFDEIKPQADEKSLQFSLIAPDSLPLTCGDGERIGQVLINLMGNAIKFTPEKGRVVLKLKSDGKIIHVEVIDNGFGVPVENRQKVFEKFYQHGDIHTRQEGGTGLGLSIAKSIVEVHGGRIWVDDGEGGRGSNFQFVLPLVEIGDGETV